MPKLPDPYTTRGLALWSLLFILMVESVWTINYLRNREQSSESETSNSVSVSSTSSADDTASSSAVLNLDPDSSTVKKGQIVTLKLNLDTGGKATDGVTIKLKYDQDRLEVVGANGLRSNKVQDAAKFSQTLLNTALAGAINFTSVADPDGPFFNGKETIAEISFKALKLGEANVSFDFTAGSTTDSNVASHDDPGTDLLKSVGNATVTIGQ